MKYFVGLTGVTAGLNGSETVALQNRETSEPRRAASVIANPRLITKSLSEPSTTITRQLPCRTLLGVSLGRAKVAVAWRF